jgi:hypothetical protein
MPSRVHRCGECAQVVRCELCGEALEELDTRALDGDARPAVVHPGRQCLAAAVRPE